MIYCNKILYHIKKYLYLCIYIYMYVCIYVYKSIIRYHKDIYLPYNY